MSSVISVENISKLYRLGEVGSGSISGDLSRWIAKVRGKEDPFAKIGSENDRASKADSEYVWSLKDINFDVKQGEVLGIIGRNGAGKSTLLKILSKVTQPTTGNIKVKGRIASLLEVGTGFHPELSGRDNIFLNGAILGMSKAEIKAKFDEIVAFSGVERYIDTPVKRYSSGMYVRLAFAVAAHLEPEILIVDEVLAVGDAEFQKKCLGKMKDVSGEGRTVLFVSHNMGAVRALCNKGLFLHNGTIGMFGDIQSAVDLYLSTNTNADGIFQLGRQGKEEIVIFEKVILKNQFGVQTQNYNFGDSITIEIECSSETEVELPYFWISIESQFGALCAANSLLDGIRPKKVGGKFVIACTFKNLKLLPQSFIIFAGGRTKSGIEMLTRSKEIGSFTMVSRLDAIGLNGDLAETFATNASPLYIPYSWTFNNEEQIDVIL